MRKTLVAAVALAPLCLAVSQRPAAATDEVSSGVNSPIATATATNGGPDDVDIASGGSVSVNGTTPAVTQNSPNNVSIEGSINISGVNNSTGVLMESTAGSLTNSGSIINAETYTASDTVNGDGLVEAPFASPSSTGRYGVLVQGPGLTGNIDNFGTIGIQGNNSYGVSIEAPLTGVVVNTGSISLTGDNGAGLRITAPVTGSVSLTGPITSTGQNSSAVNISGSISQFVSVYGALTSTGYSTTARPTDDGELTKLEATPTDVQQSAATMVVSNSVGGGIFIGAPPVGTTPDSLGDLDGDGVQDASEGTGSVTVYGNAPALLIGGSSSNITIGPFGSTDTETNIPQPANAYGLIVRGSVNSYATYDGVDSTALQIGVPGAGTVDVQGGVRVVGAISANSYDADATAIHIAAGATVPEIRNEDFIESLISHSTIATTEPAVTGYGVLIDPGASVSKFTNYGTIYASVTGDAASAYGLQDKGGQLNTVLNEGVISASITPSASGDTTSGATVALDLSANTSGVALTQSVNPNPIPIEVDTTTSSSGTTTTTASTTPTTVVVDGKTTTTAATTTATVTTTTSGVTALTTATTPTSPQIIGDVLLGSGTNNVQLLGGSMSGALDLGSGATGENSVLTLDNGAYYYGALTYGGTGLALNVNNGALQNTSATTLNLSSLHVGASGVLYAAIDPVHGASTLYAVSGQATLDSGGSLGIVLKSALPNPETFTIVQASSLTNGTSDALLLSEVPYLLSASAQTNPAAGTINITVRERTPQEMGLNPGETAAFQPVIAGLANDQNIQTAVFGQYTRSGFLNLYDQLLPDYSGGVFQLASAASDAITRATDRSNDIENPSGTRGAWAQEFAFGVDRPRTNAPGYQGDGFGFVGGLEFGGAGYGAFGLTGSFAAGDLRDPHSPGDNDQAISEGEFGAYWQGQAGGFRANARVGAGYVYFSDRRELYQTDVTSGLILLDDNAKGSSQGYTATGHFAAAYQFDFGNWFVRPEGQVDYFRLVEDGFTEHGGGAGFDLALDSRTGDQGAVAALITAGTTIGTGFRWRPEVQLGYRDVVTGTAGDTTARFAAGGDSFTLLPPSITGGGPVARVGVKGDTDFYELDFQAGAEERDRFTEADLRFSVRILF